MKNRKKEAKILHALSVMATTFTVVSFVSLCVFVLVKGIPHITADMFSLKYTSENASVVPAAINTLTISVCALALALLPGVFSAVYLCEYAGRKNKFVSVIRTMTETLAGIPSIVYGLFGYLAFVLSTGWGYSIIAGALTLSLMILPVIMRTAEEAINSVPDSFRESSYALGAGRLRTIARVVIPSALPGIVSGAVLSVGRILGETAALIYTAGTVAGLATSLTSSGRTLSVQMYTLWREGIYTQKAFASAAVLLILTVLINILSSFFKRR